MFTIFILSQFILDLSHHPGGCQGEYTGEIFLLLFLHLIFDIFLIQFQTLPTFDIGNGLIVTSLRIYKVCIVNVGNDWCRTTRGQILEQEASGKV